MFTLDELIKIIPDFEPYEVFDVDANITYSEEKAKDLNWHEYEVKRIYSLTDKPHGKNISSYTTLEVSKIC